MLLYILFKYYGRYRVQNILITSIQIELELTLIDFPICKFITNK